MPYVPPKNIIGAFNVKIAIPTAQNPQDAVHAHVATAPFFTIVDLDSGEVKKVSNPLPGAKSREINPVGIVRDLGVDALLCGYIGRWAVKMLEAAGIKVYKAHGGTVLQAIEQFREGKLSLLYEEDAD